MIGKRLRCIVEEEKETDNAWFFFLSRAKKLVTPQSTSTQQVILSSA